MKNKVYIEWKMSFKIVDISPNCRNTTSV